MGFGAAAVLANEALANGTYDRVEALRNRFEDGLEAGLEDGTNRVQRNGSREHRTGTVANVSIAGCRAADLVPALDEAGIECAGCGGEPVGKELEWDPLKAMGCDQDRVESAVRFSLSLFTTEEEIDEAVRRVVATVKRLSN